VIAREGFDISTVQGQFKKVALWSSGNAKNRYVTMMQAGNPDSPLTPIPKDHGDRCRDPLGLSALRRQCAGAFCEHKA
jgi:hypothetical protein